MTNKFKGEAITKHSNVVAIMIALTTLKNNK